MTADLQRYVAALTEADAAAAVAVLGAARARGATAAELIRGVLTPAQRRVGELWFDGSWTVADEHAATAVSEQALTLLARPTAASHASTRIVLACAPGEWHTLPARFAAELGRRAEVELVFLGGSIPPEHLQRHLRAAAADALALSCTMPTNLLGAAGSISAAHAEGVPVVVGGRAWGSGPQRAHALGADLWLSDPGHLLEGLEEIQPRELRSAPNLPPEALLMDAPPPELLQLALERQSAASSWLRQRTPVEQQDTLQDLRWLTRHAAAAVGCSDPTVLGDLLGWLLALRTPRGVPAEVVLDSCHYLADALEPQAPQCATVLRDEADNAQTT